jgi:DNA-binding NarL/FixJ family response regulator
MPAGLRVAFAAPDLALFAFDIPESDDAASLTEAEHEVALLVFDGLSNAEIAAMRSTSIRTVAKQVASILRKLDVASRAELAARVPLFGVLAATK